MENQQPRIPYDESSESTRQQQEKANKKGQQSRIYECDWFPITTSPWIASIAFIFQFLLPVHLIDSYADNAGRVFGNEDSSKIISPFIVDGLQSIAYAFCALLSVFSVLTLFFNKCEEEEGYKYLLGWIGSKMFPVLRYMIDVNLAIAAIFMIRTPMLAILFSIAALINLIISFFCQNYSLRKDYLCCKSMQYMMMWKISVILSYAISCICYYFIESEFSLMVFLTIQFIIMVTLFISYFLFGFLIYRHSSTQLIQLFVLSIFLAITAANLYDAFLTITTGEFVPNRNLIVSAYFIVVLGFLMYSIWTNIKKQGTDIQTKDPIRKIYFIFNKIENSSENINDDCQIRGIIRYHMSHPCKNENCFINKDTQSYYDSKKNKYCLPYKLNQGKTSFVKFIAKCLYEQELQRTKWDSTDLLLDYIQFYYMKLKNLFQVCKLLVELEKKFLTPFQKLRLVRLRRIMLEENRKLNEELYNGSLDLQNLIASELKFDEIQLQIKQLQNRNMQFWKYIQNYSVNLSVMIRMLKPNFQLVQKINNNWKCIANYFEIQKIWKFMFACYTLYFRNQKLKPQLIEEFGQSVHEDGLFLYETLHIDKTTQPTKLFQSKMIFQPDVCCIHITHNQDKAIIKSVSRYFQRMFGYQANEVIESSLDIMMSPCFKVFHKSNFLRWASEGMSNKQNNYDIKKVFPLKKNGYIISAFKFYKQFLCLDKQLQYVGMLKKNKQQQCVIILNQNYEIEGMTQFLASKFNITYKDYQQLIGLNILSLIPSLIQYTKFDKEKEQINQTAVNLLILGHKNSVTHQFSEKSKSKKSYICQKKQFTKSNLHLSIPGCIKQVREAYAPLHNQDPKTSLLGRIFRASKVIKQNANRKKFKVEIQAKLVNLQQKHSYLQFYIREVQSGDKKPKVLAQRGEKIKRERQKNTYQIQDQQLNQEQFNKFFENSHSSQNISLSFNDNIFIKQDNNQPVQMISHVKSITLYARILFVMFFAFLISSLFFQYNNYEGYRQNSQKTYAMVQLQLKVVMLQNKYYSMVLGIEGAKQSIEDLSNSLKQMREKNIEFKKSILDSRINEYKIYTYIKGKNTYTNDQIDILDKLYQSLIQILYEYTTKKTITIDQVQQFKSIAISPIQMLTTNARKNILKSFDQIYNTMQVKNYVYYVMGVILLVFGLLLILTKLIKISSSFVSLVQIFTQFSQTDLKRIIRYYISLDQLFTHLNKKYNLLKNKELSEKMLQDESYRHQNSSSNSNSLKAGQSAQVDGIMNDEAQEIDNANLNKKVKKVIIGKQLTNLKIRPIIYVVIFLFIYGICSFGLNLYTSIINKEVLEYKEAGEEIFKYYSAINLYFLAMKTRAQMKEQFDWGFYQGFADRLSEMKTLEFKDQAKVYGQFIKVRNQIVFGNVCVLRSNIFTPIGYTFQDCTEVAENNFEHGIQSFLFYMIGNVDFYKASSTYNLDMKLAQDLEKGMQICNLYLQFLLEKWLQVFKSFVETLQRNIIIICSCLFVVQLIIYIVFVQILIVGNLKDKFIFFRKIYNNMMPDFIVTKEKIIKAKLEVQGFIKK